MKRKLLSLMMSGVILSTLLVGCGSGQEKKNKDANNKATETVAEGQLESGKVELTVWAEEDTFEMMNSMIESFKKEYEGQADFEITLAPQSDGETKNALLGDIHAGADVFSLPDDQLLSTRARRYPRSTQ